MMLLRVQFIVAKCPLKGYQGIKNDLMDVTEPIVDSLVWDEQGGGSQEREIKRTSGKVTFNQSPLTCQVGAREAGSDQNHVIASDMGSESS